MNGAGANIGKALHPFAPRILQRMVDLMPLSRADADWCLWTFDFYPQMVKALIKLPEFKGDKGRADDYICGYVRGLKEAAYQFDVAYTKESKSKGKRKK